MVSSKRIARMRQSQLARETKFDKSRRVSRAGLVIAVLVSACGCGGAKSVTVTPNAEPHLGEAWFEMRASQLGLTVEEAEARDARISEEAPPDALVTPALAREAAVTWRALCAECHGPEGQLQGVPEMEPRPKKWGGFGPEMGFFFGGDAMRAGIYREIRDGGDPVDGEPSQMKPWGDRLAREQIWLLVAHIESL